MCYLIFCYYIAEYNFYEKKYLICEKKLLQKLRLRNFIQILVNIFLCQIKIQLFDSVFPYWWWRWKVFRAKNQRWMRRRSRSDFHDAAAAVRAALRSARHAAAAADSGMVQCSGRRSPQRLSAASRRGTADHRRPRFIFIAMAFETSAWKKSWISINFLPWYKYSKKMPHCVYLHDQNDFPVDVK